MVAATLLLAQPLLLDDNTTYGNDDPHRWRMRRLRKMGCSWLRKVREMNHEKPSPPECKGCVFPGNCPCFDVDEERHDGVVVKAETLRILLHWAVMAGADHGLYSVRKAIREARNTLGHDWMESANSASLAALTEARSRIPKVQVATVIREHWVENWEHPNYPSAVRCMKDGCDWEGRFPGDIADHVAELLTDAKEANHD